MSAAAVVLTADSSRARIFIAEAAPEADDRDAGLRELADLENAAARLRESQLAADRAGRRGTQPTQGQQSRWGGQSMKAHRAEEFAAAVCARADQVLRDAHADKLYVLAEPQFLGLLRQRMSDALRARVAGEIDSALAQQSPARIRAALPAQL